MKSIVLFFCCLFAALSLKAQTYSYHPFPDTTNYFWAVKYSVYDQVCMCTITQNYVDVMGDTITWNNRLYRKFESSNYNLIRLIRQDIVEKKVYASYYDVVTTNIDTSEYILYDFSLSVGDSVYLRIENPLILNNPLNPEYRYLKCTEIDSVITVNGYRKRFKMEYTQLPYWSQFTSQYYDYWIEGIGSMFNIYYDVPECLDFECLMGLGCFGKFTNNINDGTGIYGIYCNDFILTSSEKEMIKENYGFVQTNKSITFTNADNLTVLKIELFDFSGRSIIELNNTNTFDISTIVQGIYIVRIKTQNESISKKLFIH